MIYKNMKTIKELIAIEANPENKMLPRILASLQVDTLKDVLGLIDELTKYNDILINPEELKKRITG